MQAISTKSKIPDHIKPSHSSACRMLGFTLVRGDEAAWWEFAVVMSARLSTEERAGLAWGSLMSLVPDQIENVCNAAMDSAGMPQAAFLSDMDQASFWADLASESEKKAYCLAAYDAMPAQSQGAFLDFVGGRVAA